MVTTVPPFPCPPPPPRKSESGPDVPGIACYVNDGCCGLDICNIDLDDFICQIRTLLPEGPIFNNTKMPAREPQINRGVATVGCARVGCEQLVMGSCCTDEIFCDDEPIAPQLAVLDSYSAVAFQVLRALCEQIGELDPCTANKMIRDWAKRMGITHPDPCGPGWSDDILKFLICLFLQLRQNQRPVNWEFLTVLANRMGADIKLRYAGDFSDAAPAGWWTMARDEPVCPPPDPCPPDPAVSAGGAPGQVELWMHATCQTTPISLNIVNCPQDQIIPANCNLPVPFNEEQRLPHDPELYLAWKWLLPKLLPRGPLWCLYDCNPADCIV